MHAQHGACMSWYGPGYCTGRVYRVGIQGGYTGYLAALLEERSVPSEAGP